MPKPPPRYWWDFIENGYKVIVQSDYPGGLCLATFECLVGDMYAPDLAVMKAEQLIADFRAGRRTPDWGQE